MANGIIKSKNNRWELLWSNPDITTTYVDDEDIYMDLSNYDSLKIKYSVYPMNEELSNIAACRQIVYGRVFNWAAFTQVVMPNSAMFATSSGYLYFFTSHIRAREDHLHFSHSYSIKSNNGTTTANASRLIPEKIWGQRRPL